jgi:hypothetical protein
METLQFGFDEAKHDRGAPLMLTVPTKVQDLLDYSYWPLLKKIRQTANIGITIEPHVERTLYKIDSLAIGAATAIGRERVMASALQLILVAQHAAARHDLTDRSVRLGSAITMMQGVFPLSATISPPDGMSRVAQNLQQASERMVAAHHNLFNPHGDDARSRQLVTAELDPDAGLLLAVGRPRDQIQSQDFNRDMSTLRLEGLTHSHEHSLILMIGAVALAQPSEVATA